MRLPALLVALLFLPLAAALPAVHPPAPAGPGASHGLPVDALPAPLAGRVRGVLDQGSWIGRSPGQWLDWAKGEARPAPLPGPRADLAAATQRVYDAVGVQATPAQLAQMQADARSLDPRIAAAFGSLVMLVGDAYAEQAKVPAQLDWNSPTGQILPPELAAQTVARGERILGAVAAFQGQIAALRLGAGVPGFRDPLGLVVLGGTGNDVFLPDGVLRDPVVLADLGGDDTDFTSSGGACPLIVNPLGSWSGMCNGLALSLHVDLAGNDTYHTSGDRPVAQGSGGFGGLGILVDLAGNDTYIIDDHVAAPSAVTYYITGSSQGAGEAGVGFLIDAAGNDTYRFNMDSHGYDAFAQGQGYGGLGGFGLLLDAAGDDLYDTNVSCTLGNTFCGLYTDAVALYPGVGLLVDLAGNDRYHSVDVAPEEDYYAQSFAAFGGLSILADLGGNDDYWASSTSTAGGPELNCAFGTAEYAGALAIFLEAAGDDTYYDETVSPSNGPSTMTEGFSLASGSLFWDVAGNDTHSMASFGGSPMLSGRGGVAHTTLETYALYLDTGGADTYRDVVGRSDRTGVRDATIGGNDRVWGVPPQYFGGLNVGNAHGLGVDENLLP